MPVENMDSNLDIMRLNPAHITEFPNGFVLDNRYIKTIYDTESPDDMYYVSPGFTVDEDSHRFNTINGANEYALAHLPTYPAKATILVYPGKYVESIENSFYRIHIVGTAHTSYYLKGAILYNIGDISGNYPLKCAGSSPLNLINMTVMVDSGGTFGELLNLRADNCSFMNGEFIECPGSDGRSLEFLDCSLNGNMFNFTGVTGDRFIAFRRCDFGGSGSLNFSSTNSTGATKSIKFERSLSNSDIKIAGDWSISSYLSEMYSDGSFIFDTNGFLVFDGVLMPNGVHFISDTAQEKNFVDCNFLNSNIAVDHKDVSADVTITNVDYSGNIQQNGICGCIQINNPEKHVGQHDDRYFDLQCAIDSIPSGEMATVRIWEDLIDLPEITLPNANTNIKIKGQKTYSLAFTGDIVEVGDDRVFGFNDCVQITGGNIELNGTSNELGFESCQYINAYVTLTNGAFAILYKSSLFGATGHKAINVNTIDPIIVVGYSRCQGATGHEAVTFSVDADDKFKAKYSTFIHGDKDTSEPLTYTGATGKVDIAMYNCGLNAAWNPAKLYNTIGSANNTTDIAITF